MSAPIKGMYKYAKDNNFIHVFYSPHSDEKSCNICGEEITYSHIEEDGKIYRISGHEGKGCIGVWTHNRELMLQNSLEPHPLPCEEEGCNEYWNDFKDEIKK